MRRWYLPAFGLLAMALLVLAVTTILIFTSLESNINGTDRNYRGDLVWFATQIERDRTLLAETLSNFAASDGPAIKRSQVTEKFDILRSHIDNADKGAVGARYAALDGAAALIKRARGILTALEADIKALSPGDVATTARITGQLQTLASPFHNVARSAMLQTIADAREARENMANHAWQIIALFAGIVLFGSAMVVLLFAERAEVARLRDDLEARVQDRTRELDRINRELSRANDGLREFAMVASHDLQEPLRKIRSLANLLSKEITGQASDDSRYAIDVIEQSASRLSNLVTALLRYSRLSNAPVKFEQVDLGTVVSDVADEMATQISKADASIDVRALPKLPADPVQIRQLIQNLISNSLKYRSLDRPCRIRVKARPKGGAEGGWTIVVQDNGIGFAQQYAERIFEPFRRLHSPSQYPGAGIGLALCARIADRHGWCIRAAGRPGRGTIITIDMPAVQIAKAA